MTARLARLRRFPVKSIGGEDLERIEVRRGQPLPGDRAFAVLHEGALRHLAGGPRWLPKSACLNGAAAAPLQAVQGGWQGDRLVLTHPEAGTITVDPDAEDQSALLAWLAPLWTADRPAPARLVRGAPAFADVPQPVISLASVSSLAAVEADLGRPLGQDRWRANLWVEGLDPWAERHWLMMPLRIGGVRFKVTERIDRCPATSADTVTGRLDGDTPKALMETYDHDEFGVYLEAQEDGEIAVGDPVELL